MLCVESGVESGPPDLVNPDAEIKVNPGQASLGVEVPGIMLHFSFTVLSDPRMLHFVGRLEVTENASPAASRRIGKA